MAFLCTVTRFDLSVVAILLLAFVSAGMGCKSNVPPAEPEYEGSRGATAQPAEAGLPVFDLDYDDSWVANVPEAIAGYRVVGIFTPKNRACTRQPLLLLNTPPESVSGTLTEIFAAMKSIPELPSNIRLSVSYSSLEPEEAAAREQRWKRWNEVAIITDCPGGHGSGLVPDLTN